MATLFSSYGHPLFLVQDSSECDPPYYYEKGSLIRIEFCPFWSAADPYKRRILALLLFNFSINEGFSLMRIQILDYKRFWPSHERGILDRPVKGL